MFSFQQSIPGNIAKALFGKCNRSGDKEIMSGDAVQLLSFPFSSIHDTH